jgi:hypothetical protein
MIRWGVDHLIHQKLPHGEEPSMRPFLAACISVHTSGTLAIGVGMGICAISSGYDHFRESVAQGRDPWSDAHVQGAVPMVLFALLLLIVFCVILRKRLREARGATISPTERFCRYCGWEFTATPQLCPKCGKPSMNALRSTELQTGRIGVRL